MLEHLKSLGLGVAIFAAVAVAVLGLAWVVAYLPWFFLIAIFLLFAYLTGDAIRK